MWRAFFLAVGVSCFILGAECLAIEKATLSVGGGTSSEITPPEWAPWSLMSGGAVVLLYSFTIPKRVKD